MCAQIIVLMITSNNKEKEEASRYFIAYHLQGGRLKIQWDNNKEKLIRNLPQLANQMGAQVIILMIAGNNKEKEEVIRFK